MTNVCMPGERGNKSNDVSRAMCQPTFASRVAGGWKGQAGGRGRGAGGNFDLPVRRYTIGAHVCADDSTPQSKGGVHWLQERNDAEKKAGYLEQRVEHLEREHARLESFLQGAALHMGAALERAGDLDGSPSARGMFASGVEIENRQGVSGANQLKQVTYTDPAACMQASATPNGTFRQ
jgi:hypothetical protein